MKQKSILIIIFLLTLILPNIVNADTTCTYKTKDMGDIVISVKKPNRDVIYTINNGSYDNDVKLGETKGYYNLYYMAHKKYESYINNYPFKCNNYSKDNCPTTSAIGDGRLSYQCKTTLTGNCVVNKSKITYLSNRDMLINAFTKSNTYETGKCPSLIFNFYADGSGNGKNMVFDLLDDYEYDNFYKTMDVNLTTGGNGSVEKTTGISSNNTSTNTESCDLKFISAKEYNKNIDYFKTITFYKIGTEKKLQIKFKDEFNINFNESIAVNEGNFINKGGSNGVIINTMFVKGLNSTITCDKPIYVMFGGSDALGTNFYLLNEEQLKEFYVLVGYNPGELEPLDTSEIVFCDQVNVLKTLRIFGYLLSVVKIIIPLLLIIFATIDFSKAAVNSDQEALNKAIKSVANRAIAAVAIFFLPTIIFYLTSLIGNSVSDDDSFNKCNACLFKLNECDVEGNATDNKDNNDNSCDVLSLSECSKRSDCMVKNNLCQKK